jgi:histidinol-phosphate aminotransferase
MREHGGRDSQSDARWDFSTNANACGPCPTAHARVVDADYCRYPDPNYDDLRRELARFHGIAADRIVLGASASELIFRMTARLALQARRVKHLAVYCPPRAYGDYGAAAREFGIACCENPSDASLIWACEPSSPMGQAHADWPLWLHADAASPAASLLVLDQAYEPLRLAGKPTLDADQSHRVWRMITPNKALGLTGVRGAYLIAPYGARARCEELQQLAPSWPIGADGEAMLRAWTMPETQGWLQASRPVLRDWAQRQRSGLLNRGWTCLESDANFFCAAPPQDWPLASIAPWLRRCGIKVRSTDGMGLSGHFRLAALAPPAQDALFAACDRMAENLLRRPNKEGRVPHSTSHHESR